MCCLPCDQLSTQWNRQSLKNMPMNFIHWEALPPPAPYLIFAPESGKKRKDNGKRCICSFLMAKWFKHMVMWILALSVSPRLIFSNQSFRCFFLPLFPSGPFYHNLRQRTVHYTPHADTGLQSPQTSVCVFFQYKIRSPEKMNLRSIKSILSVKFFRRQKCHWSPWSGFIYEPAISSILISEPCCCRGRVYVVRTEGNFSMQTVMQALKVSIKFAHKKHGVNDFPDDWIT